MSQLNIHLTIDFERDLKKFMKVRHIQSKAEAVRTAIKEGLARSIAHEKPADFSKWIGQALQASVNKKPKFTSDDDLWK